MGQKVDSIEIMRQCAAVGDRIFSLVCKELKKDIIKKQIKTEIELANFIKSQILKAGGTEAFPVIVTSGPRAGNDIHPVPTTTKLTGFVIIDYGIKMPAGRIGGAGYCSDMTRTVYIGKPTKSEIELYNAVLLAQNGSARYLKAGFLASASDAFARGILSQYSHTRYGNNLVVQLPSKKSKTLDQYFIHTLGHGIGKKVHESPKLYFKSREIIKAGKVITIEPGIYIPKTLGIRIEDMYLVTDGLPEQITKSPKKLLVFK